MAYSWPDVNLVSDEISSTVKATTKPGNHINVASQDTWKNVAASRSSRTGVWLADRG